MGRFTPSKMKMNKRGQVELGIGAVLLIGVLIYGALSSYEIVSENLYAVDTPAKTIYDLTKCSIKHLNKQNIDFMGGDDVNELLGKGYRLAPC